MPVTNLIFRLSFKGPRYQRCFATQDRVRGLPFEQRELYVERSPVYQVDKIDVPVLVHLATNDQDVNFEEAEMLVHALRVKKPELAETKIYVDPPPAAIASAAASIGRRSSGWTPPNSATRGTASGPSSSGI